MRNDWQIECGSIYLDKEREDYRHMCTLVVDHPGKHVCWCVSDRTAWTTEEAEKR